MAIAARHPLVRAGAVWAAAAENGFRVVESVESVEALVAAEPIDLVVVENDPLGPPPPAATVARLARTSKVLLLASAADPATGAFVAETGAHLVVEHDAEVADLVAALHRLAAEVVTGRAGHAQPQRGAPLSRREIETMRHIGDGLTYRQVARRMGLSEATVGTYARRIREKLNAATKVEMVVNAMEFGYVARPGGAVLANAWNE
ncbi:helix-turn-helix transcriptional regulator [Lentzea sp.]|uniref:helix-turn-helix transcriptional regulator n=1 Tax=Lentzea sp. TaxID=56099 RepID=UPI002ED28DC4